MLYTCIILSIKVNRRNIILISLRLKEVAMMDYTRKIIEIANKNNGIVTASQVTDNHIPRIYLKLMVDKGLLERSCRGVYISPNTFDDELFNLQNRFRRGIFSHETALFLHDLTDRTPIEYTMTFPVGYNTTSAKVENVITYYSVKNRYEIGISTTSTSSGSEVKVYNLERTLCDLLQKRSNKDIQVLTEALKRYMQQTTKDIPLLSKYAKIFKVEKRLRPYLEVLL